MRNCIYILILIFYACLPAARKKNRSKLIVAMPNDHHMFYDGPYVSVEGKYHFDQDTVRNLNYYIYDSLPAGKTSINVFSLLTNNTTMEIDLKDSSSVFINDPYGSFKMISYDNFEKIHPTSSDTIFIGRKSTGCFARSFEKIVAYQTNDSVHLEYSYINGIDRESQSVSLAPEFFLSSYNAFLRNFKPTPLKRNGKYTEIVQGTFQVSTYIRQNENVLEYGNVKGFDVFKERIGIRDKKLN